MILREKVIIYLISFVIMIVAIDLLTFLILDDRNMHLSLNKESSESHSDIPKTKDELFPIELSINKWGRDIFYDRSYQYNSWFKLTGITQFEDGNKAIINGNIIKEQEEDISLQNIRQIYIISNILNGS